MTYARLLHDFQWMGYKSRTVTPGWPGLPSTPETVPFFRAPGGGKDDVPLDHRWEEYLRALNSSRAFKFIMSPPAGWFNRNENADSLGFAGNVVEVLDIINKSARIKTYNFNNKPPEPDNWNFQKHPELVHKFTVITQNGGVTNPAEGIDVYIFVIGRGDLYVPLSRLELFPKLPLDISVHPSILLGLEIREAPEPGSKVLGKLAPAKKTRIHEYAPRGTNVWGRIDEGWVSLCWYPRPEMKRPKYYTSWEMETVPPVPPVK
ncbi:MAG: hypothetical protein ACRDFQ_02525 [Anaerolineales bacterium]